MQVTLCLNRVYRVAREADIRAQAGYRKSRTRGAEQHVVTLNVLDWKFNPRTPNQAWVTDLTYIKPMKVGSNLVRSWILFPIVLLAGRCALEK